MTSRVLAANDWSVSRAVTVRGPSPIRHVIYVIKENRTRRSGVPEILRHLATASKADGELAGDLRSGIRRAPGQRPAIRDITPNHRALALRFDSSIASS